MKLAWQLGLVSLSLLLVPWSGCAFLAEHERALQSAQREAAAAVARTSAAALADRLELVYPDPRRLHAPLQAQGILVDTLLTPPVIDGWLQDWGDNPGRTVGHGRRRMEYRVGRVEGSLFIAATVTEPDPRYRNPQRASSWHSDRLEIRTGGRRGDALILAPEGPGRTPLLRRRGDRADLVAGSWGAVQPTGDGLQMELAIPIEMASGRLAISYIGVDSSGEEVLTTQRETDQLTVPWLIDADPELHRWLVSLTPPNSTLAVYDRWQWPLAETSTPLEPDQEPHSSLLHTLYSALLPGPEPGPDWQREPDGRVQTALLSGSDGPGYHQLTRDGRPMLIATAPVTLDKTTVATIAVSQPLEEFAALSDSAFPRLLAQGLLTMSLTGGLLLGFGAVISWRLRSLERRVAQMAGIPAGERAQLPVTWLGDEIDTLAMRFNEQLLALDDHQRYLSSLNQTLSHELRTPVAIVASSLENLRQDDLPPAEARELLERATVGIARLQAMFAALQEARRLEQAVAHQPTESVDLVAVLGELTAAYDQTYASHRFRFDHEINQAPATIAADQLVQAFDKLVDNALSFAPADSDIVLSLEARGLWWRLAVTNTGPGLPGQHQGSLFAPLVSHRDRDDRSQHMGLGLHIVKLVAGQHGGEPFAINLASGVGVKIGFSVRR